MKRLLFVCTGNTCRSPMCEKIFNAAAKERGKDATASSCGLMCREGEGMNSNAVAVMKERSLDSSHASRSITQEIVNAADYVVTMTGEQRDYVKNYYGSDRKVFSMGDITEKDIIDPYGGNLSVYRQCADDLAAACDKMLNKL